MDGFPSIAVCKSEFEQDSVIKVCFFQKNPCRVMQLACKQYEIAKDVVIMEMQQSLNRGKRFSLSLDEYLSLKHKGYLKINVHQDKDKFWNLGMVAISNNNNNGYF